jgi:hypothetical protein
VTTPTNQQIIKQYLADRERVKLVRRACETGFAGLTPEEVKVVADTLKGGGVSTVEQFQANRETHLLTQEDPELFDFLTDLYINGRDGKASAEAKKKDLGLKQTEIEKWLLKMLDKLKSKGFKTEHGTVYPTRKEAVSVEDWDAFLEAEILLPMAAAIEDIFAAVGAGATQEEVASMLKAAAHLEFINKGVNKTSVLERMGDRDEKDESRPNPPPAGVKYTAMKTVGVRAK